MSDTSEKPFTGIYDVQCSNCIPDFALSLRWRNVVEGVVAGLQIDAHDETGPGLVVLLLLTIPLCVDSEEFEARICRQCITTQTRRWLEAIARKEQTNLRLARPTPSSPVCTYT